MPHSSGSDEQIFGVNEQILGTGSERLRGLIRSAICALKSSRPKLIRSKDNSVVATKFNVTNFGTDSPNGEPQFKTSRMSANLETLYPPARHLHIKIMSAKFDPSLVSNCPKKHEFDNEVDTAHQIE
jgi:hypothetical protein